jgi:hypothetical protein
LRRFAMFQLILASGLMLNLGHGVIWVILMELRPVYYGQHFVWRAQSRLRKQYIFYSDMVHKSTQLMLKGELLCMLLLK